MPIRYSATATLKTSSQEPEAIDFISELEIKTQLEGKLEKRRLKFVNPP